MKESDWFFRAPCVTKRGLAMAVAELAQRRRGGVALWIDKRTWDIVFLPAEIPMAVAMLDASCGNRAGLVAAYVGIYRGRVTAHEVTEDLDHHCPQCPWARQAEAA